jgi:hypothetical protein
MKKIEQTAAPKWLAEIDVNSLFPLKQVLEDSLYYPACGMDGDPVKFLGGFIHSFVYVDYSIAQEKLIGELESHGFTGYEPKFRKYLRESDLVPHGWTPMPPTPEDGNPWHYRKSIARPYALWSVFERRADLGDEHGPWRFSLLYICGDGVATYQALFGGNNAIPRILAIIRPGHAFGLNWTNFTEPNGFFARTVRRFSAQQPPYLLYGGHGSGYDHCCWPQYSQEVKRWRARERQIALWRIGDRAV